MMLAKQIPLFVVVAFGAMALGACRGAIKKNPPIHLVLDMDFQDKVKAQMGFEFDGWSDGRGMRMPVTGTVARGSLEWEADSVHQDESGGFLANPLPADELVVRRGRERFDIYCSVCHDRTGSGQGLVLQRAKEVSKAAFNFNVPHLGKEQRLIDSKDGYFFQVISNGLGTMPAYGHQIPPRDRWAIVHYLRVLQSRAQ